MIGEGVMCDWCGFGWEGWCAICVGESVIVESGV